MIHQDIPENAVARRLTVAAMVQAWQQSEIAINSAHQMLIDAERQLSEAFDGSCRSMRIEYKELGRETTKELLGKLQRQAWQAIIAKTNITKVMSLSKQKEVTDQLERGELPEISEANVLAMLEAQYNNLDTYAEQLVKEVYDWVRPRIHRSGGYWEKYNYKTNIKSDAVGLGEKIIITLAIERSYSQTRKWRIGYQRQPNFTALDNVFSLLDGKGVVKTHYGPLYDAIDAAEGNKAETEYFRVWMFANRNLHLQFKRLDLLARFNQVAGGMRLKDTKPPMSTPGTSDQSRS